MVKDLVNNHREAVVVGRIDHLPELVGSAEVFLHRHKCTWFITEAALVGHLGHRHQGDRRHPQRLEITLLNALDDPLKGALVFRGYPRVIIGKTVDIQLIEDQVFNVGSGPVVIRPDKPGRIGQLGIAIAVIVAVNTGVRVYHVALELRGAALEKEFVFNTLELFAGFNLVSQIFASPRKPQ